MTRLARLTALLLGAACSALAAEDLAIGARYDGAHRLEGGGQSYSEDSWRRIEGTLDVEPNTDQGRTSPGRASFSDRRADARFAVYFPCGEAFGPDPEAVDYDYVFRGKFYAEGTEMPPDLMDRAVAGVGFHDEKGVSARGRMVTLGFYLQDRAGGASGIGFIGNEGKMAHLIRHFDWRDGQMHEYRVRKYHRERVAWLEVRIDGAVVDDAPAYGELPPAPPEDLGFWYSTSTPGTVNAVVETFQFGNPTHPYAEGPVDDPRDIRNGNIIYNHGYADQPYVVVNRDSSLTCLITVGGTTEGMARQHVVATTSRDGGKTWGPAVDIEPEGAPESSWAVPVLADSGRIYALYTFNYDNLRSVLDGDGRPFWRVDAVGQFVFRYSDDQGLSWSPQRYVIPIRTTEMDRQNIYRGDVNGDGKVDEKDSRFFWSPSAAFSDGREVYVGIAKIKDFDPIIGSRGSEGWVFSSPNLLTEAMPEKITWTMYPEGRIGLRSRTGSFCEETTVAKLTSGRLVALCRTTEGVILSFYSSDDGKSWESPEPLTYALDGKALKHPRAKPCLWSLGDGKWLVWFENNGTRGFDYRNPAWAAVAEEIGGRLRCSQPEILLYDRDPSMRISYPDFFRMRGEYYLTETQKYIARLHCIPRTLITEMAQQGTANTVIQTGLQEVWTPQKKRSLTLPSLRTARTSGFTLEMWVNPSSVARDGPIFTSGEENRAGIRIGLNGGRMECRISDGLHTATVRSDAGALVEHRWNHVVYILEPGPRILMCVVNGRLSDGGRESEFGWTLFPPELKELGRTETAEISRNVPGTLGLVRYYSRALSVSEAISNFHAGRGQ